MEKIFKKIMVTQGFTGIGTLALVMTLLKDFRAFLQRYFMDFLKEGGMLRKAKQLLDATRKIGVPIAPMDECMPQELS